MGLGAMGEYARALPIRTLYACAEATADPSENVCATGLRGKIDSMLDRFREHLASTGLVPRDASVLVGYSGGPDSSCLLDMLHLLKFDVVAGHLHHGQRPEA